MPSKDQSPHDDELLGLRMVKDRVITEADLNTALDFQRAIGATLSDVLLRLDLVSESDLKDYLERVGRGSDARSQDPVSVDAARNSGQDKTVPMPEPPQSKPVESSAVRQAPEPELQRPPAVVGRIEESPSENSEHVSEWVVVVNALVALLVRKGVVGPDEIKDEVLRTDTGELLRSGSVHLD